MVTILSSALKLSMVVPAYNPSTQQEDENFKVIPWLHEALKTSLSYMRGGPIYTLH